MDAIVYSNANKSNAILYRDRVATLKGMPIRGVHENNVKNVDLDDVSKPGWTKYQTNLFQHPSTSEWAIPVDQVTEDALVDLELASNLTEGELSWLVSETINKVTLGSTWFSD